MGNKYLFGLGLKSSLDEDDRFAIKDSAVTVGNHDKNVITPVVRKSMLKEIQYTGDPILPTDILIPANGIVDSQNNRAIHKKISWKPYEDWKTQGITGDLRFNRGEAGIFGEYENLWQSPTLTGATLDSIGGWEKYANTAAAQGNNGQTLATPQTKISCSMRVKRGTANVALLILNATGTTNSINLTFSTGIISITGGSFDFISASEIVANEEYLIAFTKTGIASGTDKLRCYASGDATIGEYTYYKDISYVGGIDYPVPYVKGIHTADSRIHPVNWAKSENWTIEMWFKSEDIASTNFLFDARDPGLLDGFSAYYNTGVLTVFSVKDGISSQTAFSVQPTVGEYSHLKVVYGSDVNLRAYLNGILVATVSTNISTNTDIGPTLFVGSRANSLLYANAYIADINIRPTADTSTSHYDSGLPWGNPKDIILSETNYGMDEYGHMRARTITATEEDAYSVVEQYSIGTETIIKYSNGRIKHIESAGSESDGVFYTFIEEFKTIESVQITCSNNSTTATVNATSKTVTGYTIKTDQATGTYTEISEGTWK